MGCIEIGAFSGMMNSKDVGATGAISPLPKQQHSFFKFCFVKYELQNLNTKEIIKKVNNKLPKKLLKQYFNKQLLKCLTYSRHGMSVFICTCVRIHDVNHGSGHVIESRGSKIYNLQIILIVFVTPIQKIKIKLYLMAQLERR